MAVIRIAVFCMKYTAAEVSVVCCSWCECEHQQLTVIWTILGVWSHLRSRQTLESEWMYCWLRASVSTPTYADGPPGPWNARPAGIWVSGLLWRMENVGDLSVSEVDGPPPAPCHGLKSPRSMGQCIFYRANKPDTEAKHDKAGNMRGVYHEKERLALCVVLWKGLHLSIGWRIVLPVCWWLVDSTGLVFGWLLIGRAVILGFWYVWSRSFQNERGILLTLELIHADDSWNDISDRTWA